MKVTVQQARESLCIIDFDDEVRFAASIVRRPTGSDGYQVSAWFIPTDAEKEAERLGINLRRVEIPLGWIEVERPEPRRAIFTTPSGDTAGSLQVALTACAENMLAMDEWQSFALARTVNLEQIEAEIAAAAGND